MKRPEIKALAIAVLSVVCFGYDKHSLLTIGLIQTIPNQELNQLQFYSDQFDLVRLVSPGEADRQINGKLIVKGGNTYEAIRFKMGTPGVLVAAETGPFILPSGTWKASQRIIRVSFEPGCDIEFHPAEGGSSAFEARGDIDYCGHRYRIMRGGYDVLTKKANGATGNLLKGPFKVSDSTFHADLYVDYKVAKNGGSKRSVPGRRVGDQ